MALEAELSSVTLKVQLLEDDKMRLLKEMEERDDKVTILTATCVINFSKALPSQLTCHVTFVLVRWRRCIDRCSL